MFKQFMLVVFITLASLFHVSAKNHPATVQADDSTAVLQECLDLSELQQYFPTNSDGSKQQVRILQHPVTFSSDIKATKFGAAVLFIDRSGTAGLDAYVNFTSFIITGNDASATFNLTYGRNSNTPSSAKVAVTFQKNGTSWTVINSTLNY